MIINISNSLYGQMPFQTPRFLLISTFVTGNQYYKLAKSKNGNELLATIDLRENLKIGHRIHTPLENMNQR